jgi:hypothetical protein
VDLNAALKRAQEVRDTYPPGVGERALVPLADAIERVRKLCAEDKFRGWKPYLLVSEVLAAIEGQAPHLS